MITIEFLTAGKATFTVENTVSGKHQTYRVKRAKKNDRFPNPKLFVSVMDGSDNESHYGYVGVLDENPVRFRTSAASRYDANSVAVRGFEFALARILLNVPDSDKVKIHHEGRCGRCGRLLTHPDSIASGIGPECGKNVHPGYHSKSAGHSDRALNATKRALRQPRLIEEPPHDEAHV